MALRVFADGTIFGERWGEAPPRLLGLHGWGRTHTDLAPALGATYAIALDLPGFGASPPPRHPGGARSYAVAMAPVLDEFAAPPLVVGHSFGGRVAVCLAAAHPGRVAALVLTGTPLLRLPGTGRRPAPGYRMVRALRRLGLVSEQQLEQARRRYGSADYRASSGVMRQVLVATVAESYEDELRSLRCPVHLVWGERDDEVPFAVARAAAALLDEAGVPVEVESVPGAGHQLPTTHPEALRAAVAGALR